MKQASKRSGRLEANSAGAGRCGHVDALKGAGILLVVLGHFIEQPTTGSLLLTVIYTGIYSFHMPLFVFLSGIFARETLESSDYTRIVWTLFLPLVAFQPVYVAMGAATGWNSYSPFAPYWILWFIASLIGWRILLPLFASPAGIAVALGGAVLVGYDSGVGYALSASRTIYFLPFFVIGHLYGRRLIDLAQEHRILFFGVFVATMSAVAYWWLHGLDATVLTGSHDYGSAPADSSFPGLGRLTVIALSLAGLLGFCALVPRRWKALEWLGARSLSIYLLHGLVVMLVASAGVPALVPQPFLLPVLVGITVLVCFTTAMLEGPMRRIFSPPAGSGEMGGAVSGLLRRLR